jgi:hypothetical protein
MRKKVEVGEKQPKEYTLARQLEAILKIKK